jgi:hypothetical protein
MIYPGLKHNLFKSTFSKDSTKKISRGKLAAGLSYWTTCCCVMDLPLLLLGGLNK